MGWLILIAIVVAVAFAARSPQGTLVLARIWVVLSALWIAAFYTGVAGHMGEPGYMGFQEVTEWALIPPAVTLGAFFVVRWIARGAERRPGEQAKIWTTDNHPAQEPSSNRASDRK